jgi:hypothetical protein
MGLHLKQGENFLIIIIQQINFMNKIILIIIFKKMRETSKSSKFCKIELIKKNKIRKIDLLF